jgi:segregation and condensation protein B
MNDAPQQKSKETALLAQKIEAVLFYIGGTYSVRRLTEVVGASETDVRAALEMLRIALGDRGLRLLYQGDECMLVTAPETSATIRALVKSEVQTKLTNAALETLAIILYRHPVAKPEIDFIRGVNSVVILRNLMIRGVIEREPHPVDARMFVYRPAPDMLRFLGVVALHELPDYETSRAALERFLAQQSEGNDEISARTDALPQERAKTEH